MIPSVIVDLSKLTYLNVANNIYLTGSIPAEIGLLTRLQAVFLNYCAVTGSIRPHSWKV